MKVVFKVELFVKVKRSS